jgi:predicted HAD superfamily Cof-like phosphohydrolase
MAPRTLATLATVLSNARDADAALTLLSRETGDIERAAQLSLFICDSRRQLITERLNPIGETVTRTPLNVSIDHLPAPIRRALNSGAAVADFGAESEDYMKLLGMHPQQSGGILSVRGLTLDGELSGFIALYEPRKRFGPRVVERLSPAFDLFALAFERIAEHEARFEAVRALEELTRNIHSEYNRAVKQLKAELEDARSSSAAPTERDAQKIAELERLVAQTTDEVQRRAERLHAVEDQVSQAVEKLQQAHVDLHSQSELARTRADLLYQVERMLSESNGDDPAAVLAKVKAALAARQ